jgi:RNA polymerase sigma-70 factor (ECF subfamily)
MHTLKWFHVDRLNLQMSSSRMELLRFFQTAVCDLSPAESPRALVEGYFVNYYPPVFRYLVITGSLPSDAEDILQETFLRLYAVLLRGSAPDNFRSWLFRVAHNMRIDRARSGARERLLDETAWLVCGDKIVDTSLDVESEMLADEKTLLLRQAMDCLTARQTEYVLLRSEGLTYREIAEMHGVSLGTVAEVCGRAMKKLSRSVRD